MKIKTSLAVLVLISGLLIGFWPGHSLAATGIIYLSPSTGSVEVGNNLILQIRITPDTTVNAIQATLNYNASDLQYNSTTLGVFSTCVQNSGGGGSVSLSCAELGSGSSSDSLIASVSFSALAASGSDNLSIANANAADNGSYTDPSSSGATINFTAPASPPPSTPPSTSPPTSKKSPVTTTNQGSGDTTSSSKTATSTSQPSPSSQSPVPTPSIKSSSSSLQFSTAALKITTSTACQAYIEYGLSQNNLNMSTSPSSLSTSTSLNLGQSLTPGTTYYYKVVLTNAAGSSTSIVHSLTTKGYSLKVAVLDANYQPLAGKTVTLHSSPQSAVTNSQGVATFTNVAPGQHHVEYSLNNQTYAEPMYVYNNIKSVGDIQTAPTQVATVTLPIIQAGFKLKSWQLIVSLLVVAGALSYAIISWRPLLRTAFITLKFSHSLASNYNLSQIEEIQQFMKTKDSGLASTTKPSKKDAVASPNQEVPSSET